jgi:hypothetical protein
MNYNRKPGSVVWPLVLITLGVVFLLNNLGVIEWEIWGTLWRMWPVLLVAIGIDLLVGRRSGFWSVVSVVLILAVFAGAFWLIGPSGAFWSGDQVIESISQELETAEQARVDIDMQIGTLYVDALSEGEDLLASGEINLSENEDLLQQFDLKDGVATLTLKSRGQQYHPGWVFSSGAVPDKRWQISLNAEIPLNLHVDSGVGKTVLDLTGLNLIGLDLDTGVGEVTVILPGEGVFDVRIDGGVGQIEVRIPEGTPAIIRVDSGLGNVSLAGDFNQQGGAYTTFSYSQNEDAISIYLNGGVGNLRLVEFKP